MGTTKKVKVRIKHMVKKIHFSRYRKLVDIDLQFNKNINLISGTNGTCKSSILHIISNSFQTVKSNDPNLKDKKCIEIIKSINELFNPKLETLTRGDKSFQDPAHGHKGSYYVVDYYNDYPTLAFRKHNSKNVKGFRYAVKPQYKVNVSEKLPCSPVIYLGLGRLVAYVEYQDNEPLPTINKKLPQQYQEEICDLYKEFTGYNISFISNQHMGNIKIRSDFNSDTPGIDSNTVSAGEDNLLIILSAIVSLKYFYDNITSHKEVDSVLLVDEFDATLHPAFQYKLLDVILNYSQEYHIQVIFTSHSLSLIEYCQLKKQHLIYLYDNMSNVLAMDNPDIYKIQMYLKNVQRTNIFSERLIPIFTEDDEARFLLSILFNYYCEKFSSFREIEHFFYPIEASIGGDTLHKIFKDPKIKAITGQFCILDGDKNSDLNNRVIVLPGKAAPEVFLFEYAEKLFNENSDFWTCDVILEENLGKQFYVQTFRPKVNAIKEKIERLKSEKKTTKGVLREENKKLFNEFRTFIKILFEYWVSDINNQEEIRLFYENLHIMFNKVAMLNGIDAGIWTE